MRPSEKGDWLGSAAGVPVSFCSHAVETCPNDGQTRLPAGQPCPRTQACRTGLRMLSKGHGRCASGRHMLSYRDKRQAFVAKALVVPVKTFVRERLRMRLRGAGLQGGRQTRFRLWPRPLDRLPQET